MMNIHLCMILLFVNRINIHPTREIVDLLRGLAGFRKLVTKIIGDEPSFPDRFDKIFFGIGIGHFGLSGLGG